MVYKLQPKKAKKTIFYIRQAIKDYFQRYNLKYAIFGKSKGLDSSVVSGILSNIPGVKPIGVIMPCESDKDDEAIAKLVLAHFQIPYIKVDLTPAFLTIKKLFYQDEEIQKQILKSIEKSQLPILKKRFSDKEKYALGNIKARLRMITLYHIAQLTGGIVIGTSNFSEWMMGFWTLYGDVGDFYPLAEIYKGKELYSIAKALKVPKESLEVEPADGLGISSTDQDQLGLPYDELDEIIFNYLLKKTPSQIQKATGLPLAKINKALQTIKNTDFKRKHPIKILRKDLGLI